MPSLSSSGTSWSAGPWGTSSPREAPGSQWGDAVVGYLGWQEHGIVKGETLTKVDETRVPLAA